MNAIIGMTHLALQTELNDRQRNYLRKVDNAAKACSASSTTFSTCPRSRPA